MWTKVRVTIVVVQKCIEYCGCVCSLSYSAFKAYGPNIVIFGFSGCTIFFPRYFIKNRIFGKKLLNIKYVLIFSTNFICNISHSKKN
jgi:cbb3-type cytochrome oxidase subunit 1